MTKKINTKTVDKSMYANYLKKAVENCIAAENTLKEGAYNAAGVSAVHAAISAIDAYCVYAMAKRCSSTSHEDAADLAKTAPYPDSEKTAVVKAFTSVIRIKNMAEYEERLLKQKEAEKAVQNANELLLLVKNRVDL